MLLTVAIAMQILGHFSLFYSEEKQYHINIIKLQIIIVRCSVDLSPLELYVLGEHFMLII